MASLVGRFNPEESDWNDVQPKVKSRFMRTQRIIDVSAGISAKDKDYFSPAERKKAMTRNNTRVNSLLYQTNGEKLLMARPGI